MKKCLKRIGLFVLFLALIPIAISAQNTTKKVSFKPGTSSTTIQGSITGYQTINYTVAAKQGQKLKVVMKQLAGGAFFNVLPQGANEAMFSSEMGENSCTITLPKSGTYIIQVYQMRSTARRNEKATYSLSISISASSSKSDDAKVAGTNYNATGDLRAANRSQPTSAKFGVIRSNGGAEVHATMLGKSKRVFVFSQGEWTCRSSNCRLSFSKISSDEWEIICNETEKYYIPDAVIYGG